MLPALRPLLLAVLLASACGDTTSGAVHITGTGAPISLTSAELTELPTTKVPYKGRTYTGVRLRDVLTHAGLTTDQPMAAIGADGYTRELTPDTLRRDDAILAYAADDALLRPDEGPLRLIVADTPDLSVEQLARLSLGAPANPTPPHPAKP